MDRNACIEIRRGAERVRPLTWQATARLFRAHYRRLAGVEANEEDRRLLAAPPLL